MLAPRLERSVLRRARCMASRDGLFQVIVWWVICGETEDTSHDSDERLGDMTALPLSQHSLPPPPTAAVVIT